MSNAEAALASLLDLSKPLDIQLLDSLIDRFYRTGDDTIRPILSQFWEHESTWTRVDQIIEQSQSSYSRLNAMNALTNAIRTRWNAIPPDHRAGIRNFIVERILKIAGDTTTLPQQQQQQRRQFLNALNIALVQVAKHEWPQQWPSFIPDLVNSSKTSQSICSNNMQILLLLSEEVFDYSRGQMTSAKAKTLKATLNAEFGQIYSLCEFILDNSDNSALLTSTLECLLRFVRWIPVQFIFETKLVETLAVKFFPVSLFQNLALQCLCEVAHIPATPDKPEYGRIRVAMVVAVLDQAYRMLPPEVDVAQLHASGDDDVQSYLRYLSIFLTDFLRAHQELMEVATPESPRYLLSALAMLQRLSLIDDQENDVVIFTICLDFWEYFLRHLYIKEKETAPPVLLVGTMGGGPRSRSDRLQFYDHALMNLRQVLISRMAKPEEVLVVVDEHGNAVRERLKNNGAIALYLSMRSSLVYLTNLDPDATMSMMKRQLTECVNSAWNPTMLNRVSWAIGSINKALVESQEKVFLSSVVHDLLLLVNQVEKKDHKAIIAANIMYVVGQYPRFLRSHWSFLTTVIGKLFEFMHERHPGVQDMACDTFLKVATSCRKTIVNPPTSASGAAPANFVYQLLNELPMAIKDLENSQIYVFYEAAATIISAETNATTRDGYVQRLLTLPNQTWAQLTESVRQDPEALGKTDTLDYLDMVLKTNTRVALALRGGFTAQISRIFVEMLVIYEMGTGLINHAIQRQGPTVVNTAIVRKTLGVKGQVLRLLTAYVTKSTHRDSGLLLNEFFPRLQRPVLESYNNSSPDSRDPDVLNLCTAFITTLKGLMSKNVPSIFANTFACTLAMITANFEDFPEHRLAFYRLLEAVVAEAFDTVISLSPSEFKLVMDSIVWAIRHLDKEIQEVGLKCLIDLLNHFRLSQHASTFYTSYLVMLTEEILKVLTDHFHKTGFVAQAGVLATIMGIVDSNRITAPLWNPSEGQFPTNAAYLRFHIGNLISRSFTNLSHVQVTQFVDGLFTTYSRGDDFKRMLKDFLVQIKEFAAHFSSEEAEAAAAATQAQEAAFLESVPGLRYARGTDDVNDD